jgi:hypothetical protein
MTGERSAAESKVPDELRRIGRADENGDLSPSPVVNEPTLPSEVQAEIDQFCASRDLDIANLRRVAGTRRTGLLRPAGDEPS